MSVRIVEAHADQDLIAAVRELFIEYQRYLDVDLCFQGFSDELASLPGAYAPPGGVLLAAVEEDTAGGDGVIGCVGVRPLDCETSGSSCCEMKRLYLRQEFRGRGAGRALCAAALDAARRAGYEIMRLDTLSRLTEAIALYESEGFYRVAPYYENPLDGVVYLERLL